ncbi:hypothetical protein ACIQC7_33285 [Kitasatospora sp. NPDC088556]|uniref:hypothetical protein n=1 Tax=Kitasatospora sp. NPDC088556 TaxID=3364076 RepID=UPI003824E4F5
MTQRGPRRRFRAAALGLTPAEPYERRRTAPVFADAERPVPLPAPPGAAGCCQVSCERRIGLGGTVMVIHRHRGDCPVWGPAGRAR